MKDIIVLCSPSDSHLGLFNDLNDHPKVLLKYIRIKRLPIIGDFIGRLILGHRVNKTIKVPYKYIWTDYKIDNINGAKCALITNSALYYLNIDYLRRLNEKGLKMFLLLTDAIDADSFILKGFKKDIFSNFWDKVYTFDESDAEKYGFTYSGYHYYSINKQIKKVVRPFFDVYYVGGMKGGREETINKVYKYLNEKDCKCYFDICAGGKRIEKIEGIHYHIGWISYSKVLNSVSNSKCILEIMQNNQNGATLRYFEAVCYNKKLLTNNKNIVNFPFYNEKWMRIFEDLTDIDIEWLKEDDDVDYHYSGEFSPTKLIDRLL